MTTLLLYYSPNTRAGRVRWLLEELGVPYEIARVDPAAKSRDFLDASPLGKVPAMRIDGAPMIESTAMLIYLADRFAERGLAPGLSDPLRIPYLQWHAYVPAALEPPVLELFKTADEPAKASTHKRVAQVLGVIERVLTDGREYLLGDQFTAVDCALGQVIGWARTAEQLGPHPALTEYGRRVAARPAAKRARAD
jgi:glutathione S-transferase